MMMIGSPFLLMVAALCYAEGFTSLLPQQHVKQGAPMTYRQQQQLQSLRLQMSSKEEEIAELEAKLRQLKQETTQENQQETTAVATTPESLKEDDDVPEVPDSIFLSEGWKEQTEDAASDDGGSTLVSAVGTIALVIGLAFFSQIPVGQEDLSKYSAIETTTQIDLGDLNRARQSGDL